MPSTVLYCPGCKSTFRPKTDVGEKKIRCPNCGAELTRSASPDETAPLTPPSAAAQQAPPKAADPWIGKVLGGCRIEKRLGHGGMAVVYRAKHLRLDIPVAVKILDPQHVKVDASFVQRFVREARSAARLRHPNVVSVLDVGKQNDTYFIIMELIEGGSVRSMIERRGCIDPSTSLHIVLDIAKALKAARTQNLVHRDIKPDNIMLDVDGTAKLADLGLAKQLDGRKDLTITQSGVVVGTPYYIAPEQVEDPRSADLRSDIYSLGATFYHMICGQVPFTGNSSVSIMVKHLDGNATEPHIANPRVPLAISRLIMHMMARKPEDRPQTPDALIEEIKAAAAQIGLTEGFVTRPGSGEQRSAGKPIWTSPLWLAVVGLLIAVTATAFGFMLKMRRPHDPGAGPVKTPSAPVIPYRIVLNPDAQALRPGGGGLAAVAGGKDNERRQAFREQWVVVALTARVLSRVPDLEVTAIPLFVPETRWASGQGQPDEAVPQPHAMVRFEVIKTDNGQRVRLTWQEPNRSETFLDATLTGSGEALAESTVDRCAQAVLARVVEQAHWRKTPPLRPAREVAPRPWEALDILFDLRWMEELAEWRLLVLRAGAVGTPETADFVAPKALASLALDEEPALMDAVRQLAAAGAPEGSEVAALSALLKAYTTKDAAKTKAAAEDYVRAFPRSPRAQFLLGLTRERLLKQPADAIAAYRRGLALDPYYLPCLEGVLRVMVAQDHRNEAQAFLNSYRQRVGAGWLLMRHVEPIVERLLPEGERSPGRWKDNLPRPPREKRGP